MTLSLVAVVTDVVRDGKPVVGFGFNSTARPGTAVPQPPIAALAPAPSNPDTPALPSPRQARGLPADPGLSPMAGGLSPIEASPFRKDIAPPVHAQGRDWLAELRQRPEARRAILLREILGPPVGLR